MLKMQDMKIRYRKMRHNFAEVKNAVARFTKYLATILQLSYDNVKVAIDL